jgi:hypothetical protein
MSDLMELLPLLKEGERLWLMEYINESEEWSVTTRRWDPEAESEDSALDYLFHGRESERGAWVGYRNARGETPYDALKKLVENE